MEKQNKIKSVSYAKWGYIFILPFFLSYAVFSLIPLADTIRNSFYEYYAFGLKTVGPNWTGLSNYISLLSSDLPKYAWNTFVMWVLGFVPQIKPLLPLIIPSIASPAVFYFMHSYMQSSLPRELIEAARIDGSREFGTFNRIVLPIMKPAIAVQAIFTFVGSWNNYFIPALVITSKNKQTLPIMIATLRGADYMNFDMGKIYMMITIAIVPIIIIYLLLSKFIVEGVTLGGVKE